MSDPAKNVEIEDVLSSIRRLVSEEGRATARPEAPAAAPKPGKLVLTPALRVAETIEPAEAAPLSLAEPVEGTEESAPWTDPDATLFSAAAAAGALPVEAEAEPDDEVSSEAEPIVLAPEDLVEEIAEDVDEAEDEPPSEEDADHDTAEPEEAEAEPEPELEPQPETEEPDWLSEIELEVEAETEKPTEDSLTARIEVLETMISQVDEDWEPDGLSADAYSGTPGDAMAWQDHDSERLDAAPEPDEDPMDDDHAILSPDEAFLDEESLRELVADIVREELQGALGERITRNVRKLVRREIHRALTAQELD
ncbi:hypothetical protein KQ247_14990 [Ruegeria pomeroyi]|jgi:hypothetical protein|uniref:Uncharacterized protein n=2 Tax=Ruegeria pomeroyi TaxID=89184 RepID=Q5LU18_RUEPO|nr:hypothetical protein [Ruegeria pomeroyi]AAV94534.1 hypothetical protein SPO1241 [Ruegeria pomeroyi DSS-3]NVK99235.1 hypothetical protein [Ruegeria pomeroyi]NVL01468.1 hypothetical protein [Ruegeria pomeroyi]QWV08118.1 hypothetical protein KQ247_14990 [Ruegeria pomeroyi]